MLLLAVALAHSAFAEPGYEVVRDCPALPADHTLSLCAGIGVGGQLSALGRKFGDVFALSR
jgi:hypothetical protein